MPHNKNQHYVPQFYFRLFSKDGSHVEAYSLKRQERFTASIKHLCSEDYFYSKSSALEKALNCLEEKQAAILKYLIQNQDMRIPVEAYGDLLSFVLLQHSRTKSSKSIANQHIEKMSDFVLGLKSDFKLVFPKAHLLTMEASLKALPLLHDMIPVVLINNTQTNFVFSDNPVVFYNTYFNKNKKSGVLGIYSPGLQIFCPINDKIMLILYDPACYSLENMNPLTYVLNVMSEQDIEALNRLQFMNCKETIFYSDKNQATTINNIHTQLSEIIGKSKVASENIGGILLHVYANRVPYDLNLSFVRLSTNVDETKIVRNEKIFEEYRQLMKREKEQLRVTPPTTPSKSLSAENAQSCIESKNITVDAKKGYEEVDFSP